MASPPSDYLVSMLEGMENNRYLAIVALAILCFDYCLTFTQEVELFWGTCTFSFASALFIVNRYLPLLGSVPVIFEFFGRMPESWPVFVGESSDSMPSSFTLRYGCDLSLTEEQGRHFVGPWSVVLTFDTVVFGLTMLRGIRVRGLWDASIFRIFLRDGLLYYATMVVVNIVNILTILLPPPEQKGLLTTFGNVVSSVLMTRLMLNLRSSELRILPQQPSAYDGRTTATTDPLVTFSPISPTLSHYSRASDADIHAVEMRVLKREVSRRVDASIT
ncbi:hypothetical protein CERSUDRAFT_95589 [Gelatoporia subvermispora B]|uniref:DUF6533 domain-containing protein n=1 Tax=Ceriporiopsis subvermispora (strain B) TaxID=914234 RepID=M2QVX0_CERS8|nr:hypothetical protein CERSUDRAFT_95589 [Gelatoporia subvermispora B]